MTIPLVKNRKDESMLKVDVNVDVNFDFNVTQLHLARRSFGSVGLPIRTIRAEACAALRVGPRGREPDADHDYTVYACGHAMLDGKPRSSCNAYGLRNASLIVA